MLATYKLIVTVMVDITNENFEQLWPSIKENIDKAVLIGIDSEFSGIRSSSKLKNSLFDSMPERYAIQRQNISPFTITQFGLTAFVRSTERANTYVAHPYNFYLCPPSFGRLDARFSCQASSLQFLRRYRFDFNKFIYGGVPFLREEDEAILREELRLQMNSGKDRANVDEHFIQDACSSVSRWLSGTGAGDPGGSGSGTVSGSGPGSSWSVDAPDTNLCYLLQKELRQRFREIWTSAQGNNVLVTRVTPATRRDLEATDDLDEQFVSTMVGFSRVIRHLRARRKPLVGHNCMLDLMLIHHLFIAPLPADYHQFKETIHSWFPEVYDTKHIAHTVKDLCPQQVGEQVNGASLNKLHQGLTSHTGSTVVLHAPAVVLTDQAARYNEESAHEAGYDAYMAGFCCLRLAHLLAHKDVTTVDLHRPMSSRELMSALVPVRNSVNVIRGTVNHLSLDGPDPVSERPRWFHLATKGERPLDVTEVVQLLSQYGAVDVRPFSSHQALVAVGNFRCAKDVMRVFKKDKRYSIAQYNVLKHSPLVRTLLWSSVLVSGLGAAFLLVQLRK
ncbi:pre-piRNA 3'-exonuclease trimmer-like isoform X2 [Amphibalanus amphitrite]|uniref:pre-piRNA 3'-exonuclease trimmer-like isoform X2 n=1 Tax=Amphibalanus amphitrite TaxID=1232801 RepID=UPI001C91FFE8|nr:pre-piRNA 3'-exonuclease trimmer-like isoform X2 [Amphibalanus amphitrite]